MDGLANCKLNFFIEKFLLKVFKENIGMLNDSELRYRINDETLVPECNMRTRGSSCDSTAAARVRPYKTCPRNYVADTWHEEDNALRARVS